MEAWAFSCRTAGEVAALVRALGKHRYVREVDLQAHWLIDAVLSDTQPFDAPATAFLARREADPSLDVTSRDPSLWRALGADEVGQVLAAFWSEEPEAEARRTALLALALAEGFSMPEHAPFEGDVEFPDHPSLLLLSWTLHPVHDLDAERHAGALAEMEKAGEEVDVSAPIEHEGPDVGLAELLHGAPRGVLLSEFVVWADGPYAYSDYVFRGASRVAKLVDPPEGPRDET